MLSEKIMDLRKQRGWSQEELASRLDVSRQSVSKWESAASVPDLDKIIRISEIFGVSTDFLLKDENEQKDLYEGSLSSVLYEEHQQYFIKEITEEEANAYIQLVENASKKIAAGVSACIFSPVILLILMGLVKSSRLTMHEDSAAAAGVIALLLIIAAAASVFITWGLKLEKFEYIQTQPLALTERTEEAVRKKQNDFEPDYKRFITVGVMLCIVCAVPLFAAVMFHASDSMYFYCTAVLLMMVAIGVFFLVWAGTIHEGYEKLLGEGDYSPEKKIEKKRNDNLSKVYWCTVTAVYLGVSFLTGRWDISWIIWPCAGVFFAAVCGMAAMLRKR